MKKFKFIVLLITALLFSFCEITWAEQSVINRKQYKKNLTYNKNALPAGWQYQAGYTLWRSQRNLAVNRNTYKMYTRDRAWHNKMRRYYRPEQIALSTFDWTVEEIALFMRNNQDYFKFHPAGIE